MLKEQKPVQAIVFCRTKRGTDRISERLRKRFSDVACIHGDMAQSARDRVMSGFREGKVKILVATDVVGRFDERDQAGFEQLVSIFTAMTEFPDA